VAPGPALGDRGPWLVRPARKARADELGCQRPILHLASGRKVSCKKGPSWRLLYYFIDRGRGPHAAIPNSGDDLAMVFDGVAQSSWPGGPDVFLAGEDVRFLGASLRVFVNAWILYGNIFGWPLPGLHSFWRLKCFFWRVSDQLKAKRSRRRIVRQQKATQNTRQTAPFPRPISPGTAVLRTITPCCQMRTTSS